MSKRSRHEVDLDLDCSEELSSNIQNSKYHTEMPYQNSCLQKHPVRTENNFGLNYWWLKWINENWLIDFLIDYRLTGPSDSNIDWWTDQRHPYGPADSMVVTD